MVGKWHVTPLTETGPSGPFDGWPLGRGYDRFYGFMDAETDQYAPELVRDNTPIPAGQPRQRLPPEHRPGRPGIATWPSTTPTARSGPGTCGWPPVPATRRTRRRRP
jgi:arylsulfatase A-like enzyme